MPNSCDLHGKSVIVTGGAKGIGRAIRPNEKARPCERSGAIGRVAMYGREPLQHGCRIRHVR